ncbi:MAG: hypothetical protein Kow0099_32250 [Candidatus Abyssubacteria bacterium]
MKREANKIGLAELNKPAATYPANHLFDLLAFGNGKSKNVDARDNPVNGQTVSERKEAQLLG